MSARRTSPWRGLFARAALVYVLSIFGVLAWLEVTFPLLANTDIRRADDPILLPRLREVAQQLTRATHAGELLTVARRLAEPLAAEEHVTLWVFDDQTRDVLGGTLVVGLDSFLARAGEAPYLLGQRAYGRDLLGVATIEVAGASYRVVFTRPIETFRVLQTMTRQAEPRRAILAAFVLGAFAFIAFALHLSRPLRRLAETARRVRVADLSVRVDERVSRRGDEIGEVAREFNRALERVEAAEESRKLLLRDVSHELRGPLTRLQVAAGIAAQSDRQNGRPNSRELEQVQREGERLEALIGQLLDLSRLEYRSAQERKLVELDRIVSTVVEDAETMAEERGSRVLLDRNPPLRVFGEAYSLSVALDNLVRNALVHTPSGTEVHVDVTKVGQSSIRVTVADDGPGVCPELAELMFEPFARGPNEDASSGTGIGLALVKRAIEAHGGTIEATTPPNGSGLVMIATLPSA